MANMKEWLIDALLILIVVVMGWISFVAVSAVEEQAEITEKLNLLDKDN